MWKSWNIPQGPEIGLKRDTNATAKSPPFLCKWKPHKGLKFVLFPATRNIKCIAKPDQVVKRPITDTSSLFRRVKPGQGEGSHWSVDDILTEDDEVDRVPLQKLKLLGESKELRNLLLNPHLQQLLLTVDQAKEKDSLMKTYMQEPLFVEFADSCLRVVEPPEKENCLLD
ncbi:zinc finger HIT domain-containing protein 3 isoform X2 [Chrysemys picta bellii]|uniref:zinc finger HIT domain-containing protein 3 isoform X2 n=1 Tax=Chrysemys picta bellii TaxID=8478 RepID=UPI0032B12BC1